MNRKKITILFSFLFYTAIACGSDFKLTWREGRDNLYNHTARLMVTDSQRHKGVADAEIFCGGELLGKTDKQGFLFSSTLNSSAARYSLKACIKDQCTKILTYQVLHSEIPGFTFISMGSDPSGSMSFTWQTSEKNLMTVAECIRDSDPQGFNSKDVVRSKGVSFPHRLVDQDKPEGRWQKITIHKISVTGLIPDTRYKYRVGDGKNWQEGTFQTAPPANSKDTFKFLFVADSQESSRENYQSCFKSVINRAFDSNTDLRFIIHTGDMVNRGINGQEWGWFYEAGEKYFRKMPLAPVIGNHETGGIVTTAPQQKNLAYLPFFNNPPNQSGCYAEGSSYSFNYGPAHFLCIDNQNILDAISTKTQTGEGKYINAAIEWINKDLMAAKAEKRWIIVAMHQPIFGANRDETELRQVLAPLFDKSRVDLVLAGHDHYYFRSFPLSYDSLTNDGKVVPMDQFGTVYVIGGSTCTKMYQQKYARTYQAVVMAKDRFPGAYPFLRNEPLALQNYSTVTVSPDKIHFRFFDRNGNQKDEVVLGRERYP